MNAQVKPSLFFRMDLGSPKKYIAHGMQTRFAKLEAFARERNGRWHLYLPARKPDAVLRVLRTDFPHENGRFDLVCVEGDDWSTEMCIQPGGRSHED